MIKKEDKEEKMFELDLSDVSEDVQCPTCQRWKVKIWQLQSRGADEMMTTYHRCIYCSYKWKID